MSINAHYPVWVGIGITINKKSRACASLVEMSEILSQKYGDKLKSAKEFNINLYDFDAPKSELKNIEKELRDILNEFMGFKIKVNVVRSFDFGIVFLEIEKTIELYNLHKKIVEKINPYRKGLICKDYLEEKRNYNSSKKEMIEKYGNPHVLDEFYHHITIGMVKPSKLDSAIKDLKKLSRKMEIGVNSIHIAINDNGKRNKKEVKLK